MDPANPMFREVVYAKNQPEYRPLPALRSSEGIVVSRWMPTVEEVARINQGAAIVLSIWTHNQPLQPLMVEVENVEAPNVPPTDESATSVLGNSN